MSEFEVRPLTPTIGAEVHGVDLSKPIDTTLRERIEQTLLDHQLIFFPKQRMSPDDHVALGRCFGELQTNHPPYLRVLDADHPEIIVIESDETHPANVVDRANVWHTDITWHECPPAGSILHMQEIPETGGDTMWTSLTAAYDALSEPMQRMLGQLTAVHDLTETVLRIGTEANAPRDAILDFAKQLSSAEHPVVRTHPRTGRKGLFVNRTFTSHIKGIPRAESDAILAFLYEHVIQPEFSVRRRWGKGDVGIWDNRCTSHYAISDYGNAHRRIHRVTILGERPQ